MSRGSELAKIAEERIGEMFSTYHERCVRDRR
jgi:hypothetical protein